MTRLATIVLLALAVGSCASLEFGELSTTTTSTTTSTTSTTTSTTTPPTTTTTLPLISLSGKVVDGVGEPIAAAMISSGEIEVMTGPDGSFTLESTAPGPLTVSKRGWLVAELPWSGAESAARVVLEPMKVRGLRVGAGAAADDGVFEYLLGLADETAVNAFVFDTKQEGGEVVYPTGVSDANEIGAVVEWYDPVARIAQAHDHDLYAITRIVVFEDGFRTSALPDEKLAWKWVDPRSVAARQYNIDLAVEACQLGFDEIQFDYVRWPAGETALVSGQLNMTQDERVAAIESFLAEARSALQPMGCSTSAAVFAIVVSVPDDQGLGQRPEELSRHVEALSPMVYPSHYSLGWLGFPDPNDHPYDVTADALDDALPRLDPGSVLRPWLQGFWWSNAQIRSSIQAAEDRDVGWILWNVRSSFERDALPTDDEVSG